MSSTKFKSVTFAFALLSGFAVSVSASNSGVTYQGRIIKPDGSPLSGAYAQFRMQLRTPDSGSCLMYEELQTQDLRNMNGVFSVTINDGSGSRSDSTGLTLDKIFANHGTFALDPTTCNTGTGSYTPTSSDGRNLVVLFKDETMSTWEPIPAQKLNFVPFAFEAKQIAGFTPQSLVRVAESDGTLDSVSPLSNANYNELLALINGTTTQYSKTAQLGGTSLPTMTTGQVLGWNGTAWVSQDPVPSAGSISTSQLASNLSIATSGTVASAVATTRDFKLYASSPSTYAIDFQTPTLASSYALIWPPTAGSANQVLTTDGTGTLSWNTPSPSQWTTTGSNISYSAGNVGIGTTAPGNRLTVDASGTSNVEFKNIGGQNGSMIFGGAGSLGSGIYFNASGTQVTNDGGSNELLELRAANSGGTDGQIVMSTLGSERMRIDSSGNVGIGTTSPGSRLVVQTSSPSDDPTAVIANVNSAANSEAGLDLYNDTGDVGGLFTQSSNSWIHFASRTILASWTNGLTLLSNDGSGGDIRFVVGGLPDANEKMRIITNGNVGIGNTSPTKLLHVGSSSLAGGTAVANFQNANGTCTITPASSGSGIACSSDERLKENFEAVTGAFALDRISQLQAVTYNFKKSSRENRRTGYKAQEIQKIAPEFVRVNDDGYLQVYYDAFIPWITEAIKTLYAKALTIENHQAEADVQNAVKDAKIRDLEQQNLAMRARLDKIEKQLNAK